MNTFETDWLASNTIFYNISTNKISNNINEVIDYNNFEWNYEGLHNYFEFGYSVFENTPIKNVFFLKHDSEINIIDNKIVINSKEDLSLKLLGKPVSEEYVIGLIESKINKWENSFKSNIIIPTSGGFDSRLLNLLLKDKTRINSFTYGISSKQEESYETIFAKSISTKLNTNWSQIELKSFHDYINDWFKLYGCSTHLHGMYHIEFYKKILNSNINTNYLLSGLIGDAWAGSVNISSIEKITDLNKIGYSHGINADPNFLNIKLKSNLVKEKYFSDNHIYLKDSSFRIIESMRTKIILLNYLINVPKSLGINVYAPFIDQEIAISMLNIDPKRRENRDWQKDFFKMKNFELETQNINVSYENNLDYQGCLQVKLKPLSKTILSEIVSKDYVEWINNNVLVRKQHRYKEWFFNRFKQKKYIWRIAPKRSFFNLSAYSAYMTLYPLQKIILLRNEHNK